jgi:prepilin peptidase CpaA
MPDADFRYILLGGLAIALAIAALTDLKRRHIDNWLNGAIALAAPLYWWASGLSLWPGVAIQIGMTLIVLFGFALIFARGGMGGGDVKLLAALALWLPPLVLFSVIFLTSLVGGAMSMVAGARNLNLESGAKAKRTLALVATSLWVAGSCYIAWVMNGGRPLQLGAVLPGFAVTAALFAALGVTAVGAVIVSRNQKSRLPVPYGLAISTGGLLVLFTQYLPPARAVFAVSGLG